MVDTCAPCYAPGSLRLQALHTTVDACIGRPVVALRVVIACWVSKLCLLSLHITCHSMCSFYTVQVRCFRASSPRRHICFAGASSLAGLLCHWTFLHLLSHQECLAIDPCHHRRCFLEQYRGCLPVPPLLNHQSRLLCSPGLQILQPDIHWWCTAGYSQGAQCLICNSVDIPTSCVGCLRVS